MAVSPINPSGDFFVGEVKFVGFDWTGKLGSGVTLSSNSAQAKDQDDADASAILGTPTISGLLSVVLVSNVVAGKTYRIWITTNFSNGETDISKVTITAKALT